MATDAFVDDARDRNDTALSRLGSSKALYADTAGEMAPAAVLAAAATAEYRAAETFAAWAEDEVDPTAADAWAATADEEREHYETVVALLDGEHEPGAVPAVQAHLRELDDSVERAGAFVGRTLVAEASKGQLTGFFVGEADPGTASTFRDLADDLEGQLARARDVLDAVCADAADRDRAAEAADAAVQTAYEEYTERLESMGVNPKPVC